MSEEKLPKHGNSENADVLEQPELTGTVRLAQSALLSPQPSAKAEAESRARVLAHLSDGELTPRHLQQDESDTLSLVNRVQRGLRRLFHR